MNIDCTTAYVDTTEWNKLMDKQNGKCIICARHQTELDQVMLVDNSRHNNVRRILCSNCKTAIELLDTNPHSAKRAMDYMQTIVDDKCRRENNLKVDICAINTGVTICNLDNSVHSKEEIDKAI